MKGLEVGQSASLTRTFTADDVDAYRALTGDSSFVRETLPGPLVGGLLSCVLGTRPARTRHQLVKAKLSLDRAGTHLACRSP